ncbi:hypothetical protein FN846DRAFT_895670 [Sphaerosporella brunnea]|uniref:Uncharacterized protein n=1 Tax=Sphaerosporella brunnea TaxID=1250544 RepID=A0A5J5EG85_9PEZI|nr:hypothetical protein FN846DRAFT_895670 [Sphaerosporella brunnea]
MSLLTEDAKLRGELDQYSVAVQRFKTLCEKLPIEQRPAQLDHLRHRGDLFAIKRRTAEIRKRVTKLEKVMDGRQSNECAELDRDAPDENGVTLRESARRGQFSHEEVDAILRPPSRSRFIDCRRRTCSSPARAQGR